VRDEHVRAYDLGRVARRHPDQVRREEVEPARDAGERDHHQDEQPFQQCRDEAHVSPGIVDFPHPRAQSQPLGDVAEKATGEKDWEDEPRAQVTVAARSHMHFKPAVRDGFGGFRNREEATWQGVWRWWRSHAWYRPVPARAATLPISHPPLPAATRRALQTTTRTNGMAIARPGPTRFTARTCRNPRATLTGAPSARAASPSPTSRPPKAATASTTSFTTTG